MYRVVLKYGNKKKIRKENNSQRTPRELRERQEYVQRGMTFSACLLAVR